MQKLLFGTAGIPASTQPRDTVNGIHTVRKLGLEAMELEFVHSVNIRESKAPEVKEAAKKSNVALTSHGQYYINLNSNEPEKIEASKKRILNAARILNLCGGWSLCFHAAYYMGDVDRAYDSVKASLKNVVKKLKDEGNPVWIRPETGGKLSQFGSLEELIKISQEVEQVLPCIDFSHHYSRSIGRLNKKEDFSNILEELEKGLGRHALDNMHIHAQGIDFTEKGEKNHAPLSVSDFNYKGLMEALKEFKVKGVLICESPILEKDALTLKKEYESY